MTITIGPLGAQPADEKKPMLAEEKMAVVTGANTGLGYHAADLLVGRGYKVIIACRSKEKGQQAVNDIKKKHGKDARAEVMLVDLVNLRSCQEFAAAFLEKYDKLHLLLCNGGMGSGSAPSEPSKQLTENGVDVLYQTNYLSHFLLILALMPSLRAAKGRVMSISSPKHRSPAAKDLELTRKVREPYETLYGFSKLAQTVMTFELHRRFGDSGVVFHCFNPGGMASNIWNDSPALLRCVMNSINNSTETAAKTLVHTCVCDEGAYPATPKYWNGYLGAGSCKMMEGWSFCGAGESLVESTPSDVARDAKYAAKLWEHSLQALSDAGVVVTGDGAIKISD